MNAVSCTRVKKTPYRGRLFVGAENLVRAPGIGMMVGMTLDLEEQEVADALGSVPCMPP